MTFFRSIRVAVMAAVLASAGFGQERPANTRDAGMSPTDPAAHQQMLNPGQADGRVEPGRTPQIPNYGAPGNTPETNSSLQSDHGREGNLGFNLGWLGLLGLAGLFGLGRGSMDSPRAPGNDRHTYDRQSNA
jgi:hypothetical protein